MEIKDIIRNRRIALGLTMKQVADAAGVNEATISRWESGEIDNMRRHSIAALAKTLSLDPLLLLKDEDDVGNSEQPNYYTDPVTAEIVEAMSVNPKLKALFHMQSHMNDTEVNASTAFHNMMIAEKRKEERLDQDDPC